MAITAADVKKLRDLTGAGMMDCKKALEAATATSTRPSRSCASRARKAGKRGAERRPATAWSPPPATPCSSSTARPTSSPRTRSSVAGRRHRRARRRPSATDAEALLDAKLADGQTVAETIEALPRRSARRSSCNRCGRSTARSPSTCTARPATCRRRSACWSHFEGDDGERRPRRGDADRRDAAEVPHPRGGARPRRSSPSGASPSRPPARRASPRPALPKIVEGRVNAFFKDFVLLEQPSVPDKKKTVKACSDEAGIERHPVRPVRGRPGLRTGAVRDRGRAVGRDVGTAMRRLKQRPHVAEGPHDRERTGGPS